MCALPICSPGFEGCHQAGFVELLGTQLHPGLLEPVARNLRGEMLLPRLLQERLTGQHGFIVLMRLRRPETSLLVIADGAFVIRRDPHHLLPVERPARGARRAVLVAWVPVDPHLGSSEQRRDRKEEDGARGSWRTAC